MHPWYDVPEINFRSICIHKAQYLKPIADDEIAHAIKLGFFEITFPAYDREVFWTSIMMIYGFTQFALKFHKLPSSLVY